MSRAMELGREAAKDLVHSLVANARASGNPREYWMGVLGLLAGGMAAQVDVPQAAALLQTLADNAMTHLGKPHTVSVTAKPH